MKLRFRELFVFFTLATFVLSGSTFVAAQRGRLALTGPSSSESPYILPVADGVVTKSILTVGDSVNNNPDGTPYRLVGIPDGLGAYDNGDGTFTLLMNHELGNTAGIIRRHGALGAFVSRWIIRKRDLRVMRGEDLIQQVALWNSATNSFDDPTTGVAFSRLCSADLPLLSAFYNKRSGKGYRGRIFMNGEETGAEGRAFAHLMNGTSYQLPRLGRFSWENSVAHPDAGDLTIVAGTDDTTPGQIYIYVGNKTRSGSAIDRAGLSNGNLYAVKVNDVALESRDGGIPSGTPFTLVNLGDVSNKTGAEVQAASVAAGATEFLRPEDASWGVKRGRDDDGDDDRGERRSDSRGNSRINDLHFVTTDRFDTVKAGTGTQVGRSRLYRLRFSNIDDPTAGGVIETLLDGTEDQQMMDNLTVSNSGNLLIQEDVGNNARLGRVWNYDPRSNRLDFIAEHDPSRFLLGGANYLTQDEESSGIIDVSDILGDGWFLLDVQAHYAIPGELVEGGQLMALRVRDRERDDD